MSQTTLMELKNIDSNTIEPIMVEQNVKDNIVKITSNTPNIVKYKESVSPLTKPGFENFESFICLQRIAMMFSQSTIVPKSYQNNVSNCAIAINIASKINEDPLTVFSNLYIIDSIPSWKSSFLMALLNRSKKYSKFEFILHGEKNKDTWGYALQAFDNELQTTVVGPQVTIAMAKAEGWYNRKGSKWPNMPELMLKYRCIAFFVRTLAPEITCGVNYIETEAEDITGISMNNVKLEPIEIGGN